MQYKLLAVSAFAASAFAVPQASSSENLVSVLSVLQTALPSTLIQEALTNSAAVSSQIASEFSAGQTPTWFTALPSDIQTYLVPVPTGVANGTGAVTASPNATALSSIIHNATAISAGQSSILASIHSQNSSVISRASLGTSTVAGATSTGASGSSASGSSGSSSGSSSSSSAGASVPTAIVGMGLAGVVGFVGVLAL